MKNEVIKFDNNINKINFKKFSNTDLDLFAKVCIEVCEKYENTVEIPFWEIKESINYIGKNIQFIQFMLNFCLKIAGTQVRDTDGEKAIICLFSKLKLIKSREVLQIKVNKENLHYFNDLTKAFTVVGYKEYLQLNSKYSKNLFRLLMQWKNVGHCPTQYNDKFYTIEETKFYLDAPEKYETRYLKRDVLDVAINELNEKGFLGNITLNIHKAKKRGAPVVGYSFSFDAQKKELTDKQKTAIEHKENGTYQKQKNKQSTNRFTNFSGQRNYSKEEFREMEKLLLNK